MCCLSNSCTVYININEFPSSICHVSLGAAVTYTYTYNGQTIGTFQFNQATTHFLQGFTTGTNAVTLTVRDTNGNTVTCTYNYIVTGVPTVACPDTTNNFAQNRLNPLSPNPASQVSFSSPSLSNFPNNANVQLAYRYSNFDVNPAVNNQLLTTIQSTQQSHSLNNLPCGSNTVTVTATDNAGNTATCTFTYFRLCVACPNPGQSTQTFTSFARPTFNFPLGAVVTYTYNYNGQDIGTFQFNQATTHFLQGFQVGTNTVTLTVRDSNGNAVTCTYNYIVTANLIISCPPNQNSQVSCAQGTSFLTFPGATAANGVGLVTITYNSGFIAFNTQNPSQISATFPAGTSSVTATARDTTGQTASCTFTATVTGGDTVRPFISCGPGVSSQVQCGQTSTQVCFNQCTATDNSGTPNVRYSSGFIQFTPQGNQQCATYPTGTTTVTATATDNCGNTMSDTITVTVTGGKTFWLNNILQDDLTSDTQVPQITCPANVRSDVQCGSPTGQVQFQPAVAFDNAGTPTVEYDSGTVQFDVQQQFVTATFRAGVSTVTATATDACGLTNSCQFTVTVSSVDDQVPTINCAPNIDRTVDCGTTNSQVDFQASAFDNCGAVTVTYSSIGSTQFTSQPQSSATMNVGTSTVTAVAQDTSGRTATCETRVSITQVDDQVPTINCAPNIDRTVDCGTTNSQVDFQASAFDNCGAVTVTYSSIGSTQFTSQPQSSATMNVGTSTVTAVAQDTSGRTATCETRVSITQVDNFPPTITCPSNIARELNCGVTSTVVQFTATAQDNCGAATVTYSSSGSTVFQPQSQRSASMNVGTSTVIAVATDSSQRTATCQFTVTVTQSDTTPPTIFCPDVTPQPRCAQGSTQVCFTPCRATDNSGISTVTYESGFIQINPQGNQVCGTFPTGVTTVTGTARDNCDISSTPYTFTVTVNEEVVVKFNIPDQ
ncbi:hyalin-like [Amphiura filiformis]|uniref:hyalin-like n=1 Tax=Amphiura filiformis TaxID=82378 RepID=UPI003B220B18